MLEEGELPEEEGVFEPDEFLENLEQYQPQCPRYQVPMRYGSTPGSGGEDFEYYQSMSYKILGNQVLCDIPSQ